ncbi:hypothetical protein F5878DRAFT_636195 [Lentinula raphanica]|uniref:Uncharacterized protein n=1 Tax=Lentinula raphanica TaxID=153919 RepID=A0AA38U4M7_9AGAR|nr:hypothetical protein F5880DRAFT_1598842 [Lentinula raphanica]KAJ3831525.1 hypothetical protein F5878DRAFT_636195 [Lentinula raphanica]
MVSLSRLSELRLQPLSRHGRIMHTFLYCHPDADAPFVQHYGFRLYTNENTRIFQIVVDIMSSEYVLPNVSIRSIYVVNDDHASIPGGKFLVIFLNHPDALSPPTTPPIPPHVRDRSPPLRVFPISDLHVIVLGLVEDANIRSITYQNFQSFSL